MTFKDRNKYKHKYKGKLTEYYGQGTIERVKEQSEGPGKTEKARTKGITSTGKRTDKKGKTGAKGITSTGKRTVKKGKARTKGITSTGKRTVKKGKTGAKSN